MDADREAETDAEADALRLGDIDALRLGEALGLLDSIAGSHPTSSS